MSNIKEEFHLSSKIYRRHVVTCCQRSSYLFAYRLYLIIEWVFMLLQRLDSLTACCEWDKWEVCSSIWVCWSTWTSCVDQPSVLTQRLNFSPILDFRDHTTTVHLSHSYAHFAVCIHMFILMFLFAHTCMNRHAHFPSNDPDTSTNKSASIPTGSYQTFIASD